MFIIVETRKANCFLLHAYELLFSSDISGGFYLRIEPLYNLNEKSMKEDENNLLIGKKSFVKSYKTKKGATISLEKGSFQFRFNPLASQYLGENIENSNYVTVFESKLDKSAISIQDNSILDASYISEANFLREKANDDKKSHEDLESAQANFVNFGKNIRLYKLIKNNIIDNEKFMEDESILCDDDEDESSRSKNADAKSAKGLEKKEEEDNDDESCGNFKIIIPFFLILIMDYF